MRTVCRGFLIATAAFAASGTVTEELAQQIGLYPISNNTYPGVNMLATPAPYPDVPDNDWILQVLSYIARRGSNPYNPPADVSALLPIFLKKPETVADRVLLGYAVNMVFGSLANVPDSVVTGPELNTTSDADVIWSTVANPPKVLGEAEYDEAFARYRLAGLYPSAVRKAGWELLLQMQVLLAPGCFVARSRIFRALVEERLYAVDLSKVGEVPTDEGRFVGSPVALFEIPEDSATNEREGLRVICIQIYKGVPTSVVTPESNKWAWRYAKMFFNHVEAQLHESAEHLGKAHLVGEAFTLSLRRSLLRSHPISQLMEQHVYGNLQINYFSHITLTPKEGPVDKLVSLDLDDFAKLAADAALEKMASNFTFPALMEQMGLDEAHFPTKYYPYREFGAKYWAVISKYVRRYVEAVYASDAELNADESMELFRQELIANKVAWVAKEWAAGQGTRGFLADLLAAVIFTESVQHAAVGFTQYEVAAVTDAFPLSWNEEPPMDMCAITTEEQVADAMPNIALAYYQRDILTSLSMVHRSFAYFNPQSFSGAAQAVANDFRSELAVIEGEMQARNAHWVSLWEHVTSVPADLHANWAYDTLLNEHVSMSINI